MSAVQAPASAPRARSENFARMDSPARTESRSLLGTLAPIALIVLAGAALRITQIDQSLYGDELWSWVGATSPSFGGMLDWVRSDQEITPPLFTALAWLSVQLGEPSTTIRLPSLVAGIATIPLIYAIALRTLGMRVAITAAVLAALSPFLAFYSIEARAYGLAVALVAASTLAMLLALERDRSRWWWVAYGALSCAAMYSHYTSLYVLAAQFAWIVLFRPESRLPALVANLAAAAVFLAWLPGVLEDFGSPAQENIESLAPFSLHSFSVFTGSFSLGHPAAGLNTFYGPWAEGVLFAGLAIAAVGAILGFVRARRAGRREEVVDTPSDRRGEIGRRKAILLFVALALAAPVGVALVSLIGDDMYVPRNLATSVPALLIALAVLLNAGPRAFRWTALVLVVGAFAYGAIETISPSWQRPDVRAAAQYVDAEAAPDDVVVDAVWFAGASPEGTPVSPTGLTLDAQLESHEAIDAISPQDIADAESSAAGHRLWIIGNPLLVDTVRDSLESDAGPPIESRTYEGLIPTSIEVYAIPASTEGRARDE